MLHRVLRRDHHERLLQRVGSAVDGHLQLIHGFEQRRLRLGRRAIDLVGQQEMREHRPALELELLGVRVVDGDADHVAGQHVGGELDAVEAGIDAARQGLGQRGLADAGNVLDQQVAAGEEAGERKAHHFRLSANRFPQRRLNLGELGKRTGRTVRGLPLQTSLS